MSYTLPQALVFQNFTASPTAVANPQRAHISGGNAALFRITESDEKLLAKLGAYDPTEDTDYLWPNRPTGGVVDQTYAKLYAENALLRYFQDLIGVDSIVAPVDGFKNRIRSSAVNFVANEAYDVEYPRDDALLDRDVQAGDVVDLRGVVDDEQLTLRTTVKAIVGDTVDDIIAAATGDDANVADQSLDVTSTFTSGPENCVSMGADGTGFDGSVLGNVNETYTIEVTESSTGGDLTTARLRVRTASGLDNADNVQPSASGDSTTIGALGLEVTFYNDETGSCSISADDAGVSDNDLITGQKWTVTIAQDFTAPTATSGGDYTGTPATTYVITVSRGGEFTNTLKPQITVTTIHGTDISGPHNVTAADLAVNIGTKGVTISFGGAGVDRLRKGDVYYIEVTPAHEGNMRTLVLNHNLSDAMLEATDLDLTLYIKKALVEIPRKREGQAPEVNYILGDPGVSDTGFTVSAGITLTDSSWTDGGVEQPLDVAEATLYMQYRAWLQDVCSAVFAIEDIADIDDIPGALHPDNPLKWAVYKAKQNAGGTSVKYTAVCNPDDTDSWIAVLELLVGRRDVYGLVPLTRDATILGLYQAHCDSQSSAEVGRWRMLWVNLAVDEETVVVDATKSSDGETVLATISDDDDVDGDQFTIVTVPASNGQFITNGVRSGDTFRFNYTTDGWDEITYDEFEIDAVINEDTLRLVSGPAAAVSVAKKCEIYRTLSKTEQAQQLATKAGTWGNPRVRAVWPDTIGSGGLTFPGYHLCAALAGYRSGALPHQGLTNGEISGFDDVSRTVDLFNRSQLDTMAESGVWIVTQNDDGNIITRHALTTAGFGDALTQEDMVISNVDSISAIRLARLEDLIGQYNVVPGVLELVRLRVEGINSVLKEVIVDRLGGQLTDSEILNVKRHLIFADRIVVETRDVVPVPLNNLEFYQNIVV